MRARVPSYPAAVVVLAVTSAAGFACSSSSKHPSALPPVTDTDSGATLQDAADADATDATDGADAADAKNPLCSDGKKDGDETDVDCGGSCAPCADGASCKVAGDCVDGACLSSKCATPSCTDGVKDGQETDVDCGGPNCGPCADGLKCATSENCKSLVCTGGVCQAATCTDGVKNGTESDVDCGGSCANCTVGRRCNAPTDCGSNLCNGGACGCPAGMIVMPTNATGGGAYCIDAHEVTTSAYNAFWTAAVDPSTQPAYCAWNTNFTPSAHWPPAAGDLMPVRDIDWCDAYAYCKWVGRVLCGKIGGGPNAPSNLAAPLASAWFNACSAQATNAYATGATLDAVHCNGEQSPDAAVPGPWSTTQISCQGGATGLFDMTGNVQEWEDSCSAATGDSDDCQARGGAFDSATDALLRCDAPTTKPRKTQADDLGLRCCAFY